MSEFSLLGKEAFRAPSAPIAPPPANTGEGKPVRHYVWIKGGTLFDGLVPLWYYIDIPTERVVMSKWGMA